jgi:DNA-binding transcriptional ArsR family regulator
MPDESSDIPHPSRAEMTLEGVLHALSDPIRLEIVRMAAQADSQPCNAFIERIPKSTMSHHWKVLREAGVIRQTQHGVQRLNSLRRKDLDARFPGLLDAILNAPSAR